MTQTRHHHAPLSDPASGFFLPDEQVLSVRDLSVYFEQQGQRTDAVRDLTFA